jgi:Pyruvate/2-oxoacid:ferredoxin oxidoreductase delta subunit
MKAESSIGPPSTPQHVLSLVEKAMEDPDALIMVHDAWCKGCAVCVDVCPKHCLEMQGPLPRLTDAALCTSCGMCEYLCPDFAIHVLQLRWQKG